MSLPLVYHPDYSIPWPEKHPFPMAKFKALYDRLLGRDTARPEQFHEPSPPGREVLETVHAPAYLDAFLNGTLGKDAQRRMGFPWSERLVRRTLVAVGGTLLTAELALRHGLACNTAGGTHHAFPDYASGYCILNDLAVTAAWLLETGRVDKVLIVDLDVHQGDGTAAIFEYRPEVFTFSMHGANNFPVHKQNSDLDVPLAKGTDDAAYLEQLAIYLPGVLDRFQPELVLYDAGVDVHKLDRLGHCELSDEGIARRDRFVLTECLQRDIPVACVIGGGYDHDLAALAARHAILHRTATEIFLGE